MVLTERSPPCRLRQQWFVVKSCFRRVLRTHDPVSYGRGSLPAILPLPLDHLTNIVCQRRSGQTQQEDLRRKPVYLRTQSGSVLVAFP